MLRRWFSWMFILFYLFFLMGTFVNLITFFWIFIIILLRINDLLRFSSFLRVTSLLPTRYYANFSLSCHSVWLFLIIWYSLFLLLLLEVRYLIFIIMMRILNLMMRIIRINFIYVLLWRYLGLSFLWYYLTTWKWGLIKWLGSTRALISTTFTSACFASVICGDVSWWFHKKVSAWTWCS